MSSLEPRRRSRARTAGPISLGASSDVGMRRPENEDAFSTQAGNDAPRGAHALISVADGMGGHQAGEIASGMAVRRLTERLSEASAGEALGAGNHDGGLLAREVVAVNGDLYEAAMAPNLQGMGTTLTAGLLVGPMLYLAHVGDSRAYLIRKRKLERLTRDHSWVEEQVEAGLLSHAEAESHPGRNTLTRALGIGPSVEVDTAAVELQPRDAVLLCSDGLHRLVPEKQIVRTVASQSPQRACDLLVERANSLGGNDNITVVVLRLNPPTQDALADDQRPRIGEALGRLTKAVGIKRGRNAGPAG